MKCLKQPRFLEGKPIRITSILEARLAPIQWNSIKIAVSQRRRTYSTISRYCVLRLAKKCNLRWTRKLHDTQIGVERGIAHAREFHRHQMCLYGEDEKLIRLAALELGITMTAFIRLAIQLYLPTLAMINRGHNFVTDSRLTEEGIRLIQKVQIFARNGGPYPLLRTLCCVYFDPLSYW